MIAVITQVFSRIQRGCTSPHLRYLLTSHTPSSSRVKLLVGLIPIIPSVSAKDEINSDVKNDSASPQTEQKLVSERIEVSKIDTSSGWERLCAMYSVDEYGNLSKEITATLHSIYCACFFGIVYGGAQQSRIAYQDFLDRNQATAFENHRDAKRRMQNHVTIHFGKGAWRWAWKLSLFTGAFMLCLTSAAAYRGQYSLVDYTLSGMVVGGMFRFRYGPAGWIAGALTGAFIGLFSGMSIKGILTFYDSTLDDVLAFQYQLDRSRDNLYKVIVQKEFERAAENREFVKLIKSHDSSVDQKKLEED